MYLFLINKTTKKLEPIVNSANTNIEYYDDEEGKKNNINDDGMESSEELNRSDADLGNVEDGADGTNTNTDTDYDMMYYTDEKIMMAGKLNNVSRDFVESSKSRVVDGLMAKNGEDVSIFLTNMG